MERQFMKWTFVYYSSLQYCMSTFGLPGLCTCIEVHPVFWGVRNTMWRVYPIAQPSHVSHASVYMHTWPWRTSWSYNTYFPHKYIIIVADYNMCLNIHGHTDRCIICYFSKRATTLYIMFSLFTVIGTHCMKFRE